MGYTKMYPLYTLTEKALHNLILISCGFRAVDPGEHNAYSSLPHKMLTLLNVFLRLRKLIQHLGQCPFS